MFTVDLSTDLYNYDGVDYICSDEHWNIHYVTNEYVLGLLSLSPELCRYTLKELEFNIAVDIYDARPDMIDIMKGIMSKNCYHNFALYVCKEMYTKEYLITLLNRIIEQSNGDNDRLVLLYIRNFYSILDNIRNIVKKPINELFDNEVLELIYNSLHGYTLTKIEKFCMIINSRDIKSDENITTLRLDVKDHILPFIKKKAELLTPTKYNKFKQFAFTKRYLL